MSNTIPSLLLGSPPFPGAVLLEVWDYGEGQTNDKEKNLRGQVHKIYDGAGFVEVTNYDFKGNPLQQIRTYTEDTTQHPDWTSIGSVNLETETYATATEYDALNMPVKLTTPDNVETNYTYDKGGLLKTVAVENVHSLDTDIVNNIEYNAKGQRSKVQYENGTTTTYQYDVFTFRVRRIRTTRHSDSKELQDLRYWYDPVGNITLQKDLAQQTVYFDGSVAEPHNDYTYDALYRLIQAAGREHAGNNNAPDYSDSSRRGITPTPIDSTDTAKMRRYIQYYEYDEAGNFIEMRHTVTGGTGNWTRYYTTANDSNRLDETVVGSGTPEVYTFDARGNIISGFIHLDNLEFNAENRLEKVEIDANRTAYYQYDSKGQRVRKTIVDTNSNIKEVRKYIGEWEVYSKYVSSTLTLERETLHINDDTGRIALIDTRNTGSGSEPAQLLRYQYSNHLGTATLELDDVGAIISYEEYFAYGSTSFQSGRSGAEVSLKRYRYTGKERDEESGLYYHGARYYIPWLARWTAVDMLQSEMPTWSSYNYGFCNPVKWKDSTGMQPEKEEKGKVLPINNEGNPEYTLNEVTVSAKRQNNTLGISISKELLGTSVDNTRNGMFKFLPNHDYHLLTNKLNSDNDGIGLTNQLSQRPNRIDHLFGGGGTLNIWQAAEMDIGRNDEMRERVDNINAFMRGYLVAGFAPLAITGAPSLFGLSTELWFIKASLSWGSQALINGPGEVDYADVAGDAFTAPGLNMLWSGGVVFKPFAEQSIDIFRVQGLYKSKSEGQFWIDAAIGFGFGTVSDAAWKPLGLMLKSPTEKSIFYISTQSAIGVGQQGAGKVISNQQKK